jgi:hypothetical protein
VVFWAEGMEKIWRWFIPGFLEKFTTGGVDVGDLGRLDG